MKSIYNTAAAIGCAAAVFFLITCQTIPSGDPAGNDALETAAVYDLEHGPLTVYDNHCSRCHGANGSLYGESFYKLSEEHMEYDVYDMMIGPAQLKPTTAEVEAMNQYHFALQHKMPFAGITNAESFLSNQTRTLQGEVTPNTEIRISKNDQSFPIEPNGQRWQISNPPQPPFTILIKRNDQTLTYPFPAQQWLSAANYK